MIDADLFKNVNDTYGHKVGDRVLMALASVAEKALREEDLVARYGGEEFVVYLSQSDEKAAKVVAERLRESIAQAVVFTENNEEVKFTVSIGIALSKDSRDLDRLIRMSDDALYKAKEKGRNCCEIYQENMEFNENIMKPESVHPALSEENNVEISLLNNQGQPGNDNL